MKLLITGAWKNAAAHIDEIKKLGHEVLFMQWEKDALPSGGSDAEGIICNGLFLHHHLGEFPRLRFVQLTSAGYDRMDMKEAERRGIDVYNAKGVYSIPIAEFVLAAVLEKYKSLATFKEQQKEHEWKKLRNLRELSGKRVLIAGCGDVGTECAKRFRAFGCTVIGISKPPLPSEHVDRMLGIESLEAELPLADIVVVSLALCDDTRGIVKAAMVREDAMLVNVSRGAVVDLTNARCELMLDVFETEPLEKDDPIWDATLITPHNSFEGEGNNGRLWGVIRSHLASQSDKCHYKKTGGRNG